MVKVITPITGDLIQEIPDTKLADLDTVFERARTAFAQWKSIPASERGRMLLEIARRMRDRVDEIAELETLNTGKLLKDTRREADRAAACFEYYGGYADKVTGTTIQVPGPFHAYTEREPYGVVVGIIPWNVPYFFAAKKIAPAVAFGNVSILKPAAETPLTALVLLQIIEEVGIPKGVVQVVTGGAEVGKKLVSDPRTDLIVFTGHHETGKAIARSAVDNLTPCVMELGGKSPQLIFADANLNTALNGVMLGIFGACGQMCIAGSRVFIEEKVYDDFLDQLVQRVKALHLGDPRRQETQIGPQTTAAQRDKTLQMIQSGLHEGAKLTASASPSSDPALLNGFFVQPTLFTEVEPQMKIMREEIFGPVLAVSRFCDEEHALQLAHETDFGLAAAVWTANVAKAYRVAKALNVGNVWINTYRVLSDLVPFGGVGLSGYGREGGTDAVNTYTRTKSVWTSLSEDLPPGFSL